MGHRSLDKMRNTNLVSFENIITNTPNIGILCQKVRNLKTKRHIFCIFKIPILLLISNIYPYF